MKILLLIATWLTIHQSSIGQTFTVSEVRKCSYANGGAIKKGDTLSLHSKFTISNNGRIELVFLNQWSLKRSISGDYAMDTVYLNLKKQKDFRILDSIYQVLKTNGIEDCDFQYRSTSKSKRLVDGSLVSWHDTDNIKINNDQRVETSDSFVLIEWDYPVEYAGQYFLLLTDIFGGYIDILKTLDKNIKLDLMKYKGRYTTIMYKVISEECRESDNSHYVVLQ